MGGIRDDVAQIEQAVTSQHMTQEDAIAIANAIKQVRSAIEHGPS